MYYQLTEKFKIQEAKLVEIITAVVPVEKIFMLGSSLLQQRTETVFLTDAPACRTVAHYWLLVLVYPNIGRSDSYVQDKIENNCQHFIPVTVIVLNTDQFNNWLSEGHRFACKVMNTAVLIHDSRNVALTMPESINQEAALKAIESYCNQVRNKVNEFIAGAEWYLKRTQNQMAAFMLHQAAEQVLRAVFKKHTGLHINTHNIEKLLRYCTMVNYQIPAVFPRNSTANKNLLILLQRAYIDTRYKDNYSISQNEIILITERIKTLKEMI